MSKQHSEHAERPKPTSKARVPIRKLSTGIRLWRQQGLRQVLRLVAAKLGFAPVPHDIAALPSLEDADGSQAREPAPIRRLQRKKFPGTQPLSVYIAPRNGKGRVNLVTDSINSGSLYGGVGTGIILSALLAQARGQRLRIITRTEPPKQQSLAHVLTQNRIEFAEETEFLFAPVTNSDVEIDIDEVDLFVTTSWWTTRSTMESVRHDRILYLLQEDERMFYPFGDERLRCEQTLKSDDISIVLNTRLLFGHFVAEGFRNIEEHGSWFEPAFPEVTSARNDVAASGKRCFLFYARPNNARNLFYTGLTVIDEAILRGILDPGEWNIILIGKDVPPFEFSNGSRPTTLEAMNWGDYHAFLRTVDLGLTLMYTPHPSYPPLDLVAAGAVAVTNTFGIKQDLSSYSANLICTDLNDEALVEGIRAGVALAVDHEARGRNFAKNRLELDWHKAFKDTLSRYAEVG